MSPGARTGAPIIRPVSRGSCRGPLAAQDVPKGGAWRRQNVCRFLDLAEAHQQRNRASASAEDAGLRVLSDHLSLRAIWRMDLGDPPDGKALLKEQPLGLW